VVAARAYRTGLGLDVGHHEARIQPLRAVLQARDDAPLAILDGVKRDGRSCE